MRGGNKPKVNNCKYYHTSIFVISSSEQDSIVPGGTLGATNSKVEPQLPIGQAQGLSTMLFHNLLCGCLLRELNMAEASRSTICISTDSDIPNFAVHFEKLSYICLCCIKGYISDEQLVRRRTFWTVWPRSLAPGAHRRITVFGIIKESSRFGLNARTETV